ncbi:MAG: amino acid ABC transporter permease [Verrucomicrobia bacterium]|nr:MAG: amino acid ABC transporter permease [Verrucomicrobiota bacterium]
MIGPDSALVRERVGPLARLPWWLVALALVATLIGWQLVTDDLYRDILKRLGSGLGVTLGVTLAAAPLAFGLGLFAALSLVSASAWRRQLALLYVQVVRGVPMLVLIFVVAFVLVPWGMETLRWVGTHVPPLAALAEWRSADVPMLARVLLALVFAYGAFMAETLRGGLTSLGRGQAEAARALGLSRRQALRHVLLPQTFRRVLPTLGNDLISLLKDSSLVSVLGVRDITQEARLFASATFRYTETLTLVGFFYLSLSLLIALLVRGLERRYRRHAA